MKKLLGIVVLGLLLSGNAYSKEWIFTYKNYYDMTVLGVGYNKNITKSIQKALLECQEQSKKKNLKPEGCLKHDQQQKSVMAELFNKAEKIIVWNKYVDEFEKTLKPEDIIVMATDGLWDNLFEEQVVELIVEKSDMLKLAKNIAEEARFAATEPGRKTPWSDVGGKLDDISIIAAQMVSS